MIITNLKQLEQFKNIPGIYKLKILKHGKKYIGEAEDLYDRLINQYQNEIKYNINRPIIHALKYHGFNLNSIEIELINWGDDMKDVWTRQALETACIDEYDTLTYDYGNIKGNGYNVLLFCFNRSGTIHSPETLAKLEKTRLRGENHPLFGIGHTQESKDKMSKSQKALYENGYINPNQEKQISIEQKEKLSNSLKEYYKVHPNPNKKNKPPKTKSKISEKTRQKMKDKRKLQDMSHLKKKVKQIDKDTGQVIKIWDSISEASKFFGISHSSIYGSIKNIKRTIAGFRWQYL